MRIQRSALLLLLSCGLLGSVRAGPTIAGAAAPPMDRFAPAPPRPARLVFPAAPKRAVFTPTLNRHPGIKVAGPTIVHASVDDRKLRRNARLAIDAFKRSHGLPASGTRRLASVDVSLPNVTGINHWWRYEEGSIPGIGRYMVNLWQQNLLIQSDDMDVPHRGIDLAFRRTYNSYSGHDYAGSDGSAPIGQFGTGWTNTFDAHIAQTSSGGSPCTTSTARATTIRTTRPETSYPPPEWKVRRSRPTTAPNSSGARKPAPNTPSTRRIIRGRTPDTPAASTASRHGIATATCNSPTRGTGATHRPEPTCARPSSRATPGSRRCCNSTTTAVGACARSFSFRIPCRRCRTTTIPTEI